MAGRARLHKTFKLELTFTEYHPPLFLDFWLNKKFIQAYRNITGIDVGVLYLTKNNQLHGYMQSGTIVMLISQP